MDADRLKKAIGFIGSIAQELLAEETWDWPREGYSGKLPAGGVVISLGFKTYRDSMGGDDCEAMGCGPLTEAQIDKAHTLAVRSGATAVKFDPIEKGWWSFDLIYGPMAAAALAEQVS